MTRALQSTTFQNPGGVPWAWQTDKRRKEILVSNIGWWKSDIVVVHTLTLLEKNVRCFGIFMFAACLHGCWDRVSMHNKKQMASDSSHIIGLFTDFNWLIKWHMKGFLNSIFCVNFLLVLLSANNEKFSVSRVQDFCWYLVLEIYLDMLANVIQMI